MPLELIKFEGVHGESKDGYIMSDPGQFLADASGEGTSPNAQFGLNYEEIKFDYDPDVHGTSDSGYGASASNDYHDDTSDVGGPTWRPEVEIHFTTRLESSKELEPPTADDKTIEPEADDREPGEATDPDPGDTEDGHSQWSDLPLYAGAAHKPSDDGFEFDFKGSPEQSSAEFAVVEDLLFEAKPDIDDPNNPTEPDPGDAGDAGDQEQDYGLSQDCFLFDIA